LRNLSNPNTPALTIPAHKELKTAMLRRLIRDLSLSVDEFIALLK